MDITTKRKFVKAKLQRNDNKLNEIFISRKRKESNVEKFYYKRAYELFYNMGYNELFICGLGANVNKAIKVALFITEALPKAKIDLIQTETVNHIDEYINEEDNNVIEVKDDRKSNLIKIKMTKIN